MHKLVPNSSYISCINDRLFRSRSVLKNYNPANQTIMINKKPFALLFAMFISLGAFSQGVTLQPGNALTEHFSLERLQRIDKVIKRYVDSGWIVGANAFIAHNGKVVYNKAFGLADMEKKTPMR